MLLAERAGRELERRSNPGPRGMAVITGNRRNRIRPIGLLHLYNIDLPAHEAGEVAQNDFRDDQDPHEPTGFV